MDDASMSQGIVSKGGQSRVEDIPRSAHTDYLARIEQGISNPTIESEFCLSSIAISLKRIADHMERHISGW